jgi:hypothetical protein
MFAMVVSPYLDYYTTSFGWCHEGPLWSFIGQALASDFGEAKFLGLVELLTPRISTNFAPRGKFLGY